jgi:hypothetical protein
MRNAIAIAVVSVALFTTNSVIVAAPGQIRPGEPTEARMWVQNRGIGEAVPITIQEVDPNLSMRVQVAGMPPVQITGVVQTRPAPNVQWEYQTVRVAAGSDPAAALNPTGRQGWETTGLQFETADGTVVVLKRPR